jgi:hypothetical protein
MVELRLTIFEGAFAEFSGFLLEPFNGTFVNTTALVDQVTGGGRFSGIDVTNDCDELATRSDLSIR